MRIFKAALSILSLLIFPSNSDASNPSQEEIESFFRKYESAYQDIVIQNKVYPTGLHLCENRYQLIRPILDKYKGRNFTLLDIGASQGYFSFKVAQDYPAVCMMLEGAFYRNHLDMLKDLCRLNSHLQNVFLLPHMINTQSLNYLSQLFQFDVVLAFLVIHQIAETDLQPGQSQLQNAIQIFDAILKCGKEVIIETSLDVFPEFDRYIADYCQRANGRYLGEVQREKQTTRWTAGRLYWFRGSV